MLTASNMAKHTYPQQFLNTQVFVGMSPSVEHNVYKLEEFEVIINVSDAPFLTFEPKEHLHKNVQVLWFPIQETCEWPLATLDAIVQALQWAHVNHKKVYIHCEAGANRSPTCVNLWHQIFTPTHTSHLLDEALAKGTITPYTLEALNHRYTNMEVRKLSTDGVAAKANPKEFIARVKHAPESEASLNKTFTW